jgi:hypothetical protein
LTFFGPFFCQEKKGQREGEEQTYDLKHSSIQAL